MRLVVIQNVFGACVDKTDADSGIDIINLMLKSHYLIPDYFATCISLTGHFMTDTISPFPPRAASLSHTHTLSLCLSAILLSYPLSPFDIKMLSDNFMLSMNKRILLRTVLISKCNINTKLV